MSEVDWNHRILRPMQDQCWWKAGCDQTVVRRDEAAGDLDNSPRERLVCGFRRGCHLRGERYCQKAAQGNSCNDDPARIHAGTRAHKAQRVLDGFKPQWDMNPVGHRGLVGSLCACAFKVMGCIEVNAGSLQYRTEMRAPAICVAARTVQEDDGGTRVRFLVSTRPKFVGRDADGSVTTEECQNVQLSMHPI